MAAPSTSPKSTNGPTQARLTEDGSNENGGEACGNRLLNRNALEECFDSERFIRLLVDEVHSNAPPLDDEASSYLEGLIAEYAEGVRYTMYWVQTELQIQKRNLVITMLHERNARHGIKYSRKAANTVERDVQTFFNNHYYDFFCRGLLTLHGLRKLDPNCAKYAVLDDQVAAVINNSSNSDSHVRPPAIMKNAVNSMLHLLSYDRSSTSEAAR